MTERRDDDVVYADMITGLAPLQGYNIYNVDAGRYVAQDSNILVGTVSVRFAASVRVVADGSTITGWIDVGGTSGTGAPSVSSEYHAAITGQRHLEG